MWGTLEFERISKKFGKVQALDQVSFSINRGEFFSLLGSSGCGKTTLLRLVAGFEQPDEGRILLDGQDITQLPPNKRPVNTVFQNYALFPHLSVWENIAFGLKIAKRPSIEIKQDVEKMLYLMQMEDQAHKMPDEISGGQKQRVAIARALVNKPRVLLLDEPLSALDLKLRQKMLLELDLIHDEVGITFLFVTHDQSEAMAVSDRIAVMHHGKIEQIGSPVELYETPKSSFVAAFIGDTNFLDGTVSETVTNEKLSPPSTIIERSPIEHEYSKLIIDGLPPILCFNDKKLSNGELVHLSVRPEKIQISRECPPDHPKQNCFSGIVEDIVYKGDHTKYWVKVEDYRITISQQHRSFLLDLNPIRWKETVWLWWHADDGFILERYLESDEQLTHLPPEKIGGFGDNSQQMGSD